KMASRFAKFHPLRLYGAVECLIGLVAIVLPLTFRAMIPVYQYVWKYTNASFVTFSIIRFALSALILLVPTFLMGATLPIVSSFVAREPSLGKRRIGLLYTFNTLGAVLGCVGAGLILFPRIGLARTQWVAVALNLVAAAGAFWLSSRKRSKVQSLSQSNQPEPAVSIGSSVDCETTLTLPSDGAARLLVGVYAISGFVAMLYEVAWSRALVLALGSSTYAYTIMLATFLFGLALGAWLATRLIVKAFSALVSSGLCQLGIALATFLSVFLMEEMPYFYLKSYEIIRPGPAGLLNLQFLLAAALMLLPTVGLGAMFPITIQGLNSGGEK